ncbi:cryptochrome/photolyase family protein [Marinomonas epiphytica]
MICDAVWLRNDLRLVDNPALFYGQQAGNIRVVIITSHKQWKEHHESEAKTALRLNLINELAAKLAQKGIPLSIIEEVDFSHTDKALGNFCHEFGIKRLWYNQETPLDEQKRDHRVQATLSLQGVECCPQSVDLMVPTKLYNQQGNPFQVFTPFYKRWLTLLQSQDCIPLEEPQNQAAPITSPLLSTLDNEEYREDLWPANFVHIRQRLWHFCHHKENQYSATRDFPATAGTSSLSPYFALGAIGPRQCLEAIQYNCEQQCNIWQHSIWLKELAWRDFYRQLMWHFPNLCKEKPFKPATQQIIWHSDESQFTAWCQGKTGFPIVDAAMRQLNQTGWMHNRLRMICASFFCKLLFHDWRQGEKYFMSKLIDADFASNNGGWQWSASTGCDAAPYFRVFNPTRQSQTYDPNGDFIKRFLPELASLDAKSIHDPNDKQRQQLGYPVPIIDYKSARASAIATFADL